jgi:L-alanine-DL-glutamate epimerase-like enolase superfamily enzyme
MHITDVQECSIAISRYAYPALNSSGLTTSLVRVITDSVQAGRPVIGWGYASVGRYAQGGLIRERFAPRLLTAPDTALLDRNTANLDPFRAWDVMMTGEKPGGHGERCVAIGALDMALWDAVAKIAGEPLYVFLAKRLGRDTRISTRVHVYAGGGYPYPRNDLASLSDEMRRFIDLGFKHAKMKIGNLDLTRDLMRIEAAAHALGNSSNLAVDAMNTYGPETSLMAASALAPFRLWWFEDVCDPHDFATHARLAASYQNSLAAGEALFSVAEARLLDAHGGLRRDRDFLLFDPVHCYGLTGYLRILDDLTAKGWPRPSFWPHGGHLFCLHLAAALGLGGAEVTPFAFHPFARYCDKALISDGHADLPQVPGIGFELNRDIVRAFSEAFG